MSAVTTLTPEEAKRAAVRRQAILMVAACTVLGAAGQILIKMGANSLPHTTSPMAMLMDVPLMAGYALYGIMTVLFVFALRGEELSVVYPIISLNYVWVAGLSVLIFHERMNWERAAGVLIIVLGVCILGKDGRR